MLNVQKIGPQDHQELKIPEYKRKRGRGTHLRGVESIANHEEALPFQDLVWHDINSIRADCSSS